MKPVLEAPASTLLKLRYNGPLSNFAFNSNLRHYIKYLLGALLTSITMTTTPTTIAVRDDQKLVSQGELKHELDAEVGPRQIMLATSCDAIYLEKRGSLLCYTGCPPTIGAK